MKMEDLILPGALLIGGYFLYTMLKGSIVGKAAEAVGQAGEAIGTTTTAITSPVLPPLNKQLAIDTPSPIQLLFPQSLVPNIINTAATDMTGKINPLGAALKATTILGLITGQIQPKTSVLTAKPKAAIKIVSKTPTGGVKILRPLEIVKTGQAIKAQGAYKKPGGM